MLNERINYVERPDEIEENKLEEIAKTLGLNFKIPPVNTPAYKRLEDVCSEFMEAVEYQINSPQNAINEKSTLTSDKRRRSLHNNLCVLLFGTTWQETSPDNRRAVADFAAMVSGKEEYIGTF